MNDLKNQTDSNELDETMKNIFLEYLKKNNLTDTTHAKLLEILSKDEKGCKSRCCKKVLGICIKWCFDCGVISGGIGVLDVIGIGSLFGK